MGRRILGIIAALLSSNAWGQTSPGFVTGQVPSAVQWNAAFAAKQDYPIITGYVVGPASATDTSIARFNGTTGKLIQNSPGITVSDIGAITSGISVAGNASTVWLPTYFGNAGAGVVSRINRLLLGVAINGSSDIPQSTTTWEDAYVPGLTAASQVSSVSASGNIALTGSARTSDFRAWAGSASGGSQGITGLAVNDDTTPATTPIACGVCGIVMQTAGVNGIALNQLDVGNAAVAVTPTPFSGVQSGSAWGLGITSGAYAVRSTNPTGALYIGVGTVGGSVFQKGIVTFDDCCNKSIGAGGNGVILEMARGQSVRWLNSGNTTDSELWGNASGLNLTGALIASGAVSAASATLGTPLTVANGGTGAGTFTTNAIIKGNGTSALAASGCSVDANNSISCSSATTFQPQSVFQNTTADSGAAVFNFQKSRTGAAVNTGDSLGILVFQGFTTSYVNAAEIYASTAGAVSGANVPTTLTLKTSNSAGQLNNSISFDSGAHFSVILQPTATTVTSCGSSPSISGAKDLHGTVTVGTGAPTACTIGFGATFASTPDCVVTSNPQVAALSWVTSTSGIVVTQTGTSSNKLVYSCLGGGS